MFSSTIIPTIGRPTLSRAVKSVLEQDFDDEFEIIIVNDSGRLLPNNDWHSSPIVKIINTNRRERSHARNTGATIAQGKYLHFLDDDDWILPGSLQSLKNFSNQSKVAWLYGGFRLVDSTGNKINDHCPDEAGNCFIRFMAGEWLPLQSSLIDSDAFFSVGGFADLKSLRGGNEDVDLLRQFSLRFDIAGISNIVAIIRFGLDDTSTNYSNLSEQSRQSREKALNNHQAFTRMKASAKNRKNSSGYWHGRIIWNYATSIIWNIREKRLFTAASRSVYCLTSFVTSSKYIFYPEFWRGATRPHIGYGWLESTPIK